VKLIVDCHRKLEGFNANNAEIRTGSEYAHRYNEGIVYKLAWTGVIGGAVEGDFVMGIGMAKTKEKIRFSQKVTFATLPYDSFMPPPATQTCEVVGFDFSWVGFARFRLGTF
jgi:hypothetical protein